MAPKGNEQRNIFYMNSTSEFHEMCTMYTIYGSFDAPRRSSSQQITSDAGLEHSAFINLINEPAAGTKEEEKNVDAWMENSERIYSTIRQIASLLEKNSKSYTYQDIFTREEDFQSMSDDDVTIFESSIASFMTSTASQIDTLRQSIEDMSVASEDVRSHRTGIISHLVSELREIMDDFRSMQLVRNREELDLYRDPLKCCYHEGEKDGVLDMPSDGIGHAFELDEEYLDMLEREEEEFQASYEMDDSDDVLRRILAEPLPSFPTKRRKKQEENFQAAPQQPRQMPMQMEKKRNALQPQNSKESFKKRIIENLPSQVQTEQNQAVILQQEQIFLTAQVQNTKLDAAHKVESQMMQITSLLSQFSSLISEQQEEIQVIADSTVKSRQNVDKGREKLVLATEQRKRSRHYFAWIIFSMGLLLLFLNAVLA